MCSKNDDFVSTGPVQRKLACCLLEIEGHKTSRSQHILPKIGTKDGLRSISL